MQPVDQQPWAYPPFPPSPVAEPGTRGRTWMIALTAVLVELVIIGAVCNQGLRDNFERYLAKHENGFIGQLARCTQVYGWRWSSSHSGMKHAVLSQYLLLATVFVLTAAFVVALARGAVTFGRVFIGTWLAVIVATEIGAVVQLAVVDTHPHFVNWFTYALFVGPTGYHFVAGLALGLVVGLLVGIVAVISWRPAAVAVAPERFDTPSGGLPAAPAPWSEPARAEDSFATAQFPVYTPPAPTFVPPQPTPPPARAAEPEQPSSAQPSAPASDATTQIPRVPPEPPDDPNKTTMLPRGPFPRPPGDEELGHQPE